MTRADALRLVSLAALWGASFLFMRIAAPAFGPAATADLRMLIAGGALAAWFRFTGFEWHWRRNWRAYVALGMLNSGVPFVLWAYAALTLPAGFLSVINATSPMWGALLMAMFTAERITRAQGAGLLLGVVGVALVTQPPDNASFGVLPVAAALAGAFCYGCTGVVLKLWNPGLPARGLAAGTQFSTGIALLPLAAFFPPAAMPGVLEAGALLALGLLCGAIAYLLYFRLISDLGPTGALTVTYLIPVFGVLFGAVFLGEPLSAGSLAGGVLVIAGTVLVLRK